VTDLELARAIATKAHGAQKYGDLPYYTHLDSVEEQCRVMYDDDRTFVIAQLHDILEDTAVTPATLHTFFDDDVVEAVVAMTKLENEDRKVYLTRCKSNQLARKVKIADTFCNLRQSLERGDMKRVNRYGSQLSFLAE